MTKVLDLGDEGRRHCPHECAVADTEVDLVADRDRVIAEVDYEVVAAHSEDRDALGWLQTVRVHVLPTEGQDCLVHGPAAGAGWRHAEGRLSTISPGLGRFHGDLDDLGGQGEGVRVKAGDRRSVQRIDAEKDGFAESKVVDPTDVVSVQSP